jgi:bifunctional UDP-N-acetylglucosamine pyrophosphorylase/glucosamine-1-phosphate N-acetyltransferase
MGSNVAAIILAAGKGTRLKLKDTNKVTLPFLDKPMINYGVELMDSIVDKTVVVIGFRSNDVKAILREYRLIYAYQRKRLGTGHAVKIGCRALISSSPSLVLIGYGDHLMFYKKETVRKLIEIHKEENATVSLMTTVCPDPNKLSWGKIIRDEQKNIVDIVEQKDADENIRKVKEVNPGFYCFDYTFLKNNIGKLKKSRITHEYYLTDMIKITIAMGKKVIGMEVPFAEVGVGINNLEDLQISQKFYTQNNKI